MTLQQEAALTEMRDLSLHHVKNRALDSAQQATKAFRSRLKLRENARRRLSRCGPEQFEQLAASAAALHEHGHLFISKVALAPEEESE